ncbi:MAG: cytochrome bc1 complex cytochrome b subunit [Georgenia sp.]
MAGTADFLDNRVGAAKAVKFISRKIFPEHWSFMLGEVALWSFIVLILTGFFLTLFFEPSMTHTTYPEDALPVQLQGQPMSAAMASTVYMSFEVKGGLLMRQMHHWAALLFTAAIVVHMFRVFFTGAFRKPREINWLIGFTMLILALLAGFSGYSLPDDVLSGNGLRIADGVAKSIPIIGSFASYGLFGGEFPGTDIVPRLFTVHILLIPALLVGLVSVHLILMVVHKHTQYPAPGRTDNNVVGYPAFPVYVAKMAGFFFIVFGFIALLGTLISINNVWNYGAYDPSPVSAGAQPDWYMLFMEGALRLTPGWEFVIGGYTLSLNVLIPALIVPGLLFTAIGAYPFIERAATKDLREHHVLDRPRNVPVRTATGVAIISAFVLTVMAGSNDLIATHFHLSINDITWAFRILFFVLPVVAFVVTKRICLALQRRDRELALHGYETGRIVQLADGRFMEVHKPLTDHERWILVQHEPQRPVEIEPATDAFGVDRPGWRKDVWRRRLSRFFYEDRVEPVTPAELAAAQHHGGEIEGDDGPRKEVHGGALGFEMEVKQEHHDDGVPASTSVATLEQSRS